MATGDIESLVGVFQDKEADAACDLLQEAKFASLARTELPVTTVKKITKTEEFNQRTMRFDMTEEGTSGSSRINPVEEIGVITAYFLLKDGLLSLERENADIGRQAE